MVKLEVGGFYKTRDGQKVGPAALGEDGNFTCPGVNIMVSGVRSRAPQRYYPNGNVFYLRPGEEGDTIVAIWNESPVRTVERKEIVPGEYGKILVDRTANEGRLVVLGFQTGGNIFPPARSIMSADDLTAAIATLTTIRDALREVVA